MKLLLVLVVLVLCFVLLARGTEPVQQKRGVLNKPVKIEHPTGRYNNHVVEVHLPGITEEIQAKEIALRNGFTLKQQITGPFLKEYYLFERDMEKRDARNSLDDDSAVKWWQEASQRQHVKRDFLSDNIKEEEKEEEKDYNELQKSFEERRRRYTRPHPGDNPPHGFVQENQEIARLLGRKLNSLSLEEPEWTPPTDPLFSRQWHLTMDYAQDKHHVHIHADGAWKRGKEGLGITVGVVDDGLDHHHEDIKDRYKSFYSWDFNREDPDPTPMYGDSHGTSAAGVIVASENTKCGIGVVPKAHVGGLKLLSNGESDSVEAQALSYKCTEGIDIYSCSWGPQDDGRFLSGPGKITRQVFKDCTDHGRDGKGVIYVWAGGNGRWESDNSNRDGYANDRHTIAVGAVNFYGQHTWYSEPGANLVCVAPSSGSGMQIATTDSKGHAGDNEGDCTSSFGGTSAAAPQVAGVVAMILETNPDLNWREVQDIIALCSDKRIYSRENEGYIKNSAGYSHSHDLGFGVINADQAVECTYTNPRRGFGSKIKHYSTGDLESPVERVGTQHSLVLYWEPDDIQGAKHALSRLEHVELSVNINTEYGSKCLGLYLYGPSGVNSTLSHTGQGTDRQIKWTYMTMRHWGESIVYNEEDDQRSDSEKNSALSYGREHPSRWSVKIRNLCERGKLHVHSWKMDFYGH